VGGSHEDDARKEHRYFCRVAADLGAIFLEIRIYEEIYYSNKSDFVKTRKKISFTLNFSSSILAFSSSKKFF